MKSGILRAILVVVAAGVLPLATGCNSSSTSTSVTTGPTSSKCGLTLSGPSSVSSSGGTSSVTVAAQPECGWTASTQAGWISDLSPASGQGNGKFDFRAAPNTVNSQREGEIIVNDTRVRIAQDAAPCHFALSPEGDTIPAVGSTGTISVTGPAGCAWTAVPSTVWINIESGVSGTGTGTVTYRVGPNNSSSGRNGSIAIGDRSFSVMQAAVGSPPVPPPSCAVTLSSTSQNIGASGGAGAPITISAASGCSWMALSNAQWITVTSGANGTANGTVRFTVDANTGASRTGTIAIAGQTFTVTQAAGTTSCSYGINPSSASPGAGASNGTVNVTAGNGCGWNAGSNASWLSITSGANGSGNGSVGYSVAANSGAARSGTLTIAGQTFTVSQAAGQTCSYTVNPTSFNVNQDRNDRSITVTAGSGCAWTAVSNAGFIDVRSGDSGSGNGTVSIRIASFNGNGSRTGTLTVAGHTVTVTQTH